MDPRDTPGCSRSDVDTPPVPPVVWDPNCTCFVCLAFVDSWAMRKLEGRIMKLSDWAVLDGWRPRALFAEVGRRARRGPFAEEIVLMSLAALAGEWSVRAERAADVAEVEELAVGSQHQVGHTVRGWLLEYAEQEVDIDLALDGVVDVLEIMDGLADPPRRGPRRSTLRSVPRDPA